MKDKCIEALNLTKHFFIYKHKSTAFRLIRALLRRELLKEELLLLKNISFSINKGDKVALIGKNGSGKTTLLRILTGIYSRTSGDIYVEGVIRGIFNSLAGLNVELSVIDNISLFGALHGISQNILARKVEYVLDMTGLGPLRYSTLRELSVGQLQRLSLGVFFLSEGDIYIIDEILGWVDREFEKKCETYFEALSSSEKTLIMCSHNTVILRKYCKKALWLDKGNIRMYGPVNEVIGLYENSLGNKE